MKAYNSQTGETMVLQNGQWVPEKSAGRVAINPQTGERMEYKAGKWVSTLAAQTPAPPISSPAGEQPSYKFDPTRESPFGVRAMASIRMTPQGQAEYLKTIYGPENVDITGESIFIRDPETGTEYRHDIPGATRTDIADIIPDIAQLSPEIL